MSLESRRQASDGALKFGVVTMEMGINVDEKEAEAQTGVLRNCAI